MRTQRLTGLTSESPGAGHTKGSRPNSVLVAVPVFVARRRTRDAPHVVRRLLTRLGMAEAPLRVGECPARRCASACREHRPVRRVPEMYVLTHPKTRVRPFPREPRPETVSAWMRFQECEEVRPCQPFPIGRNSHSEAATGSGSRSSAANRRTSCSCRRRVAEPALEGLRAANERV